MTICRRCERAITSGRWKRKYLAVSHCMTRMRFALIDPYKAGVKAINAMKVVNGSFTQSGQFQVIIGDNVSTFYSKFVKEGNIEGDSKDDVKQATKSNQTILQNLFQRSLKKLGPKELKAFLTRKVISFEEVNKGVFSKRLVGRSVLILPENEILFSPADTEVAVLMNSSKHACGLRLVNNMELLLYIGLGIVDMAGEGCRYLVAVGQKLKKGDPLIHFDKKKFML